MKNEKNVSIFNNYLRYKGIYSEFYESANEFQRPLSESGYDYKNEIKDIEPARYVVYAFPFEEGTKLRGIKYWVDIANDWDNYLQMGRWKGLHNHPITFRGETLIVWYNDVPKSDGIDYDSNGEGCPSTEAYQDILKVTLDGVDVTALIDEHLEEIEVILTDELS